MKNLNDILLEDYSDFKEITEDSKAFALAMEAANEVEGED